MNTNDIQNIVSYLLETYRPHALLLHGSRARGDHTPHSDVDIVVVTDQTAAVDLHHFSIFKLDLSLIDSKTQEIKSGNTPIWPLKILYDDHNQYGLHLVHDAKQQYDKGPTPLSKQEWENRKHYTERLMQRIIDRGDNFLVRQYYLGDFYERIIRYFYEKNNYWTQSIYKALPEIQDQNPIFYSHLNKLWTSDYAQAIVQLYNQIFSVGEGVKNGTEKIMPSP